MLCSFTFKELEHVGQDLTLRKHNMFLLHCLRYYVTKSYPIGVFRPQSVNIAPLPYTVVYGGVSGFRAGITELLRANMFVLHCMLAGAFPRLLSTQSTTQTKPK